MTSNSVHICLLSVHGLIRGHEPELGRDADTGGQVLYAIELARALAAEKSVARVDLVTRLVDDPQLDDAYAQPEEPLSEAASILRIPGGPPGYLPKEQLWDHLDALVDNLVQHYQSEGIRPDIVHSHYADGGYVGSRVAAVFGVPLVHTGHSLGRVKRRRLLATGLDIHEIEARYTMSRRIEAEELTLASAARVITSTHQEIEEQYEPYDFYNPEAMRVVPPGTDLSRFRPPQGGEVGSDIATAVRRFLREPDKPMILAISRADPRKNVGALVRAYGEDAELQQRANLVLVMGNRQYIADLDDGARDVMSELLRLIDRYDLYGRVAYPKQHRSEDVPILYRLATLSGGVFVNPALTEPFGLTLIEAAASGLPIVATEDGGPRDIVGNCQNGELIDPLESDDIGRGIRAILGDWESWQQRSQAGLEGVREHYSWQAHAHSYVAMLEEMLQDPDTKPSATTRELPELPARSMLDRALFTDLNRSLLGDEQALAELLELIRANRKRMVFGINTGLRLDAALRLLRLHRIPEPDFLITSAGTHICYAPKLTEDEAWSRHIEKQWTPQVVRRLLADLPGISLRERAQQSEFKVSFSYDVNEAPPPEEIIARLYQEEQAVNVQFTHGRYLNILPVRASKGLALRYVAAQWGLPLERVLAIGGSSADADMMRGNTLAAVVGNRAHEELSQLRNAERIYFASASSAAGVLEAMEHYDFLGECREPDAVDSPQDGSDSSGAGPEVRPDRPGATTATVKPVSKPESKTQQAKASQRSTDEPTGA